MNKFYQFTQNNSGGYFDHDTASGIGYCVFIEAHDAGHANARAEQIGLYFDGCRDGQDCSCCGDRWSDAWGDGDETPMLYGEKLRPIKEGEEPYLHWDIPSYIHYLDGTFAAAAKDEQ